MANIRELRAKFTATAKGFNSKVKGIRENVEKLGTEGKKDADQMNKGFGNLKTTLMGFGGAYLGFQTLQGAIGGVMQITGDYQASLDQLQTQTGATDKEMKDMSKSLKNIYKAGYGQSFTEIADAMSLVKTTTGKTGKALEGLTENAMMLQKRLGIDVAESTKTADTMMKQFGITGKQAMTLIAQGSQEGLNKSGDMMDSFNEYSVYFKQLGFDAEGMWNVFKSGAESGAFNMDKVGDAVKEFGIRVKDGSATTDEAFTGLGMNADEMAQKFAQGGKTSQKALQSVFKKLSQIDDPIKRNTIGVKLFGTQFEDLEQETVMALGNVREQANMTGDTLKKMESVKYDNISSAFKGIKRSIIVDLLTPIQTQLMPLMNKLVAYLKTNMPSIKSAIVNAFKGAMGIIKALAPILGNLFTIFKNIAPLIAGPLYLAFLTLKNVLAPLIGFLTGIIAKFSEWKGFKPMIVGIATALGVYMAIMKASAIQMKIMATVTKAWAVAQRILNMVMRLNPIGIVVSLIIGLVAALIYAYKNSEKFRKIVQKAWTMIKVVVMAVINWFKANIPIFINFIISWFKNMGNWISTIFKSLWNFIKLVWNGIKNAVLFAIKTLVTIAKAYFNAWKTAITFIFNAIKTVVMFIWNALKTGVITIVTAWWNIVKGLFNLAKNIITAIFNGIKTVVLAIWNRFKSGIVNIVTAWWNIINRIFNVAKNIITSIFSTIKNVAVSIWNALKNGVVNTVTNLWNRVVSIVNSIKSAITNSFQRAKDIAQGIWDSLKRAIQNTMNGILSTIEGIMGDVMGFFRGFNLFDMGKDIIQGLINGVGNMAGALVDKVQDVVGGAVDWAKSLLDINSPSRVFMEIGQFTGEGLAIGIGKMKDMVAKATGTLANASVGTINDAELNPMTGTVKVSKGSDNGGNNYNAPLQHVENQYINDETDTRAISSGLYGLQRNSERKKGR